MTCSLLGEFDEVSPPEILNSSLVGNLVSTVHRVKVKDTKDTKDDGNSNGSHESAYFVFADVSVKIEGLYRLRFSLFELKNFEQQCTYLQSIISTPFWVHSPKSWPGMPKSSPLTQVLSDQGVKLRIARIPRTKKRGPASDDYQRRHYKRERPSLSSNESIQEEPGSQRDSQRSTDVRHDSIDQSYSQIHGTAARGYFQGINHYTQNVQYHYPPRKRPRVRSIHTSADSLCQITSMASPNTPSPHNTIFQQPTFKYAENTNEQIQGRHYDNTGMMISPQISNASNGDYNHRAQINAGFPQTYDTRSQPSTTNQQQINPRYVQVQYNMSGPSASTQTLAFAPSIEHMHESAGLYGHQPSSQTMTLPNVMAQSSALGRPNNSDLGDYNNFVPTYSRPPYQPVLGSSQPFSVENMTAPMIPSFQASARRNSMIPRTMDQFSYIGQPVAEAGIHPRYDSWGNHSRSEEHEQEDGS